MQLEQMNVHAKKKKRQRGSGGELSESSWVLAFSVEKVYVKIPKMPF